MKKIISALLAVAMLLSISVMAADTNFKPDTQEAYDDGMGGYTSSVEFEGQINIPPIKVTLPTAGTVFVNPYQLEAQINGDTAKTEDGIFSIIYGIESMTTVPLDVKVSGSVTPGGNVKLVASKAAFSDEDDITESNPYINEVVAYVIAAPDGAVVDTTAPAKGYSGTFTYVDGADNVSVFDATVGADTYGMLTEKTVAVIDAGVGGDTPEDATDDVPGVAAFRFGGEANKHAAWTTSDTLSASLVFNFVPHIENDEANLFVATEGLKGDSNKGNGTATATLAADTKTITIDVTDGTTAFEDSDTFTFAIATSLGAIDDATSEVITITYSTDAWSMTTIGTDNTTDSTYDIKVTSEDGATSNTYKITQAVS